MISTDVASRDFKMRLEAETSNMEAHYKIADIATICEIWKDNISPAVTDFAKQTLKHLRDVLTAHGAKNPTALEESRVGGVTALEALAGALNTPRASAKYAADSALRDTFLPRLQALFTEVKDRGLNAQIVQHLRGLDDSMLAAMI